MLRRITAYGLLVCGILTIIFFREYKGSMIPYPALFYLPGLASVVAGIFILTGISLRKKRRERRQLLFREEALRKNGLVLRVSLASCEIKEHFYAAHTGQMDGTGFPEGIRDMERYTPAWRQAQSQEVHQCVLVYDCMFGGQRRRFASAVISKDKATLGFLLDNQKETVVYVDKDNADHYYFDVGFLNE